MNANAVTQYDQVGARSAVASASPYHLIQMLMERALAKVATAKGHMQRSELGRKGEHISWAIAIIEGLKSSLDLEAGGELAENLVRLYDYMMERLLAANLNNDPAILDEVYQLLQTVKEGWDGIAHETVREQTEVSQLEHSS